MTRSKTLATWIAVLGGTFGLHRLYLRGTRDVLGWLHVVPATLGIFGVMRLREFGQDDRLGWMLAPLLGLMIAQAMMHAIVYGLTSDERWAARLGQAVQPTRWGPVLGAVTALFVGATALMSSIAYGLQKLFEAQLP